MKAFRAIYIILSSYCRYSAAYGNPYLRAQPAPSIPHYSTFSPHESSSPVLHAGFRHPISGDLYATVSKPANQSASTATGNGNLTNYNSAHGGGGNSTNYNCSPTLSGGIPSSYNNGMMPGGGNPSNYITSSETRGPMNNYDGVAGGGKSSYPNNHSFSHSFSESPTRESSEETTAGNPQQQQHSANVSVANSKASNSNSIGKYITSCNGTDRGTNV
jgi:hypothetical protein